MVLGHYKSKLNEDMPKIYFQPLSFSHALLWRKYDKQKKSLF